MFELGPEQLVKALEQPSVVVDLIVAEIKTQGLDGLVSWLVVAAQQGWNRKGDVFHYFGGD